MKNPDEMLEFSDYGKALFNINKVTRQVWINYGYAMLTIAGADGEVSAPEMDYLVREATLMGAPPDIIEAWKSFDFQKGNLEELLPTLVADRPINPARSLLYSSILVARADQDYPKEEREAVNKAAQILGIDQHVVQSLNALVELEESVKKIRQGLLETVEN